MVEAGPGDNGLESRAVLPTRGVGMRTCNAQTLRTWLGISSGTILTSAGFVGGAAAANNSFFGAPASPGLMLLAAAAAGGADGALGKAVEELDAYCECLGDSCEGQCRNLRANLEAIRVVMRAQGAACVAAAGIAWIPWAGAVPMYVILGALIAQGIAIGSAMVFYSILLQGAAYAERRSVAPTAAGSGLGSDFVEA